MNCSSTYNMRISDGRNFRVLISQNGGFHASCLWYEGGMLLGAVSKADGPVIHLEHRSDTSLKKVLEKIHQWAVERFNEPIDLSLE